MKINRLNTVIILGFAATIGILIAQLVWTYQAFTTENKKFAQKVHIALLEVARELYEANGHELNTADLIQRVSNDYYVVNINDDIDPLLLQHFLKKEFTRFNIITDYEYAIYNCESDEMMYGKYISINDDTVVQKSSPEFTKYKDLVYYFAVRFPQEKMYLFTSMKFWLILSFSLMLVLVIYVYSIYKLLQQKKYSELQRDFVNNMTHEFKTPLSSILLASNYLYTQQSIRSDEKLEKYSGIIIDQANKLNLQIERILNIARNDESALSLHLVPVHLKETIQGIADSIMIKNENAIVEINIPNVITISADSFHFTNAIHNILENAVKYGDKNPVIQIQLLQTEKGRVLHISDNGPGVPSKHLSFIFDKFFRVDDNHIKTKNGFGLGLYYVKRIAMQHGWRVGASLNENGGLTVSILFSKK